MKGVVLQYLFFSEVKIHHHSEPTGADNLHSVFHLCSICRVVFLFYPRGFVSRADSTLLISDFEPLPASAEVGTEDEFDPIPVTGRKNSQGEPLNCLCRQTSRNKNRIGPCTI